MTDVRVRAVVAFHDDLFVHDDVTSAIAAAEALLDEVPARQVGVALGELAADDDGEGIVGDRARAARDAAEPGRLCVTEAVLAAVGGALPVHELGLVSIGDYEERFRVFGAGSPARRDHDVLVVALEPRLMIVHRDDDGRAEIDRGVRAFDHAVFTAARDHGGLVQADGDEVHTLTFVRGGAGLRAAGALLARWEDPLYEVMGNLRLGLDRGELERVGGHLVGTPRRRARRLVRLAELGTIAAATPIEPREGADFGEHRRRMTVGPVTSTPVLGQRTPLSYRLLRLA